MIKFHTFIKGLVWEAFGVLILGTYTLLSTDNWQAALQIGVGYPLLRVILWYPYERIYKRIRRSQYQKKSHLIRKYNLDRAVANLKSGIVKTQIKLECAIDRLEQEILEVCIEYVNGKRTATEMDTFNRRIDEINNKRSTNDDNLKDSFTGGGPSF